MPIDGHVPSSYARIDVITFPRSQPELSPFIRVPSSLRSLYHLSFAESLLSATQVIHSRNAPSAGQRGLHRPLARPPCALPARGTPVGRSYLAVRLRHRAVLRTPTVAFRRGKAVAAAAVFRGRSGGRVGRSELLQVDPGGPGLTGS